MKRKAIIVRYRDPVKPKLETPRAESRALVAEVLSSAKKRQKYSTSLSECADVPFL